ncbi:hypothetical protein SH528x_004480 [Novipirellula sp. SH528]|uniref:hypothetical protein n=1 Tax=Novipirellula sp. SH528 TaxID=3454466 RepID=UPI003F9F08FE
MRRFSLRTLVFTIPLLFGVALAFWGYQRSKRQAEVLRWYHDALTTGDTLPLPWLVQAFGQSSAKSRVQDSARDIPELIFDDQSRVAQIERAAVTDGTESGDGVALYTFGANHGVHCYHAPLGARIERIAFTDDGLDIVLHGDLKMGSFEYSIDANTPETYHIEWMPHTPPLVANIYLLVWQRHQSDSIRRPDH